MDLITVTEHLNAIKRTCLFCNCNKDLADKIGVPSQANNNNFDKVGQDKRFVIYEMFNKEYQEYVGSTEFLLSDFLDEYQKTSEYFINNEWAQSTILSQKETILEIIRYVFFDNELPNKIAIRRFVTQIYDPVGEDFKLKKLNIGILLLLLYKVIPTYDSRMGAVENIKDDYAKVKDLLSECYERFGVTEDHTSICIFDICLKDKVFELNRISLITLFYKVINHILNSINPLNTFDNLAHFNIEGIWIDKENKDLFFEIDENDQCYFMKAYRVDKMYAYYTWYGLSILQHETVDPKKRLQLCTVHPKGRKKHLLKEQLGSLDTSSDYLLFDDEDRPREMTLIPNQHHPNYEFNAKKLHRLSQKDMEKFYAELESKKLVDKYEKYKSEYIPDSEIYAITREFIYVISGNNEHEGEIKFLYKIPKERYIEDDIYDINIYDSVGECIIANDGPYLGFERIGLYIDIRTEEKMLEAGIELVKYNEII